MPGPFTHIYTERRLADFLATDVSMGGVSDSYTRQGDGDLLQPLDTSMLGGLTPTQAADRGRHPDLDRTLRPRGPRIYPAAQARDARHPQR